MVHSALNGCYIVALGSFSAEWNQQNIKKWVVRASGQVEPRVTDNTTHLVTTTKEWERKGTVVQDATKRIADGQELYIVSYDWLDDCLQSKSRKREKKYRIFDGKGDRTGAGGAADEPRSAAGLMKQLYEESTELTPAAKKNLEQQQAVAQELERAKEAEKMKMFQETRMSLPEQALVFKKGAQKGKQLLLSGECGAAYGRALEDIEHTDYVDNRQLPHLPRLDCLHLRHHTHQSRHQTQYQRAVLSCRKS